MKKEGIIETVDNKKQKQEAYREQLGKYRKAFNHEFYFEALLIVYAMLEDRLRSFLYYIGAFHNVDDPRLNVKQTKTVLRRLYFGSDENAEGKILNLNQISGKEKLIRATVLWVKECKEMPEELYLSVLKKEYEKNIDMDGLLNTLSSIDDWREYRNEIIHGLLNKNKDSVNKDIKDQVEAGMKCARFIDNQVKALKKKNNIRILMKIK